MIKNYDTRFCCEHCGHEDAGITHTYVIARTFEDSLPCTCNKSRISIAEKFRYCLPEIWEEVGYLKQGHFKLAKRELLDRLPMEKPVEGSESVLNCPDCFKDASPQDYRTEQIGDDEIVEEPDAWRMQCDRCNEEAQFGWTEPDREGLIIPLSNLKYDTKHIWVDPGFQHRELRQEG